MLAVINDVHVAGVEDFWLALPMLERVFLASVCSHGMPAAQIIQSDGHVQNLGWRDDPMVIMYASATRRCKVLFSNLHAAKQGTIPSD